MDDLETLATQEFYLEGVRSALERLRFEKELATSRANVLTMTGGLAIGRSSYGAAATLVLAGLGTYVSLRDYFRLRARCPPSVSSSSS